MYAYFKAICIVYDWLRPLRPLSQMSQMSQMSQTIANWRLELLGPRISTDLSGQAS